MGQPVTVSSHETLDPNVRRYEVNRWLTGMSGRLYFDPEVAPLGAPLPRPGTYLAQLIEITGVKVVYVYGSEITVTKSADFSWDAVEPEVVDLLANSNRYYEAS